MSSYSNPKSNNQNNDSSNFFDYSNKSDFNSFENENNIEKEKVDSNSKSFDFNKEEKGFDLHADLRDSENGWDRQMAEVFDKIDEFTQKKHLEKQAAKEMEIES